MLQSKLFCKTKKDSPKEAEVISHKLLLRADFVGQLASGIYSFLPLGLKTLRRIEEAVRQEMDSIGGQEILMPALQPKNIWEKSGRWNKMDPPLFKLKDRHNKDFALGSTHEEVIVDLAKDRIHSYNDLPLLLYQIQTKFRNEIRFTGGLLRTREFLMKDLYSFHKDKEDLDIFFKKVLVSYKNIFKRCGLDALQSRASGGVFTKEETYEFQIISQAGEDKVVFCKKCSWASNLELVNKKTKDTCPNCKSKLTQSSSIEAGHTFRLGSKYARDFNLYFADKKGKKRDVLMGCYGIGLGRLMAAVIEINHDSKGMIWPKEIAPFDIHLIEIEKNKKVKEAAQKLYKNLQNQGFEILYDDRDNKTGGEKFAEADLIGIPRRIVVSERTLSKKAAEVKERTKSEAKFIKMSSLASFLRLK